MISQLPEIAEPNWLAELNPSTIANEPFSVRKVLTDSLYYPSSGLDGDPIKYLAGNIFSFVYVDQGRSHRDFSNSLNAPGLRGYDLLASRAVAENELTPNGWRPDFSVDLDGDPWQYLDWIGQPFCTWSIFRRQDHVPANHGPSRFSLLYLCADGVAAFQAMYLANAMAPKAIAVIQPGHAFGGNWTDYTRPENILARSVLGNEAGRPDVLLYGGIGDRDAYRAPCWPAFQTHVCFLAKGRNGSIGIWLRN